MAIQRQININKTTKGTSPRKTTAGTSPPKTPKGTSPRAAFSPNPLAAGVRDQIFWTNNYSVAHWPGLLNPDNTINTTFFMPNQIAGNGDTSASFSPSAPATFSYACSIHPDEKGTITVT